MLKIKRNEPVVINNTDKNVGHAFADSLISEESRWQLCDKVVDLLLYKDKRKCLLKIQPCLFWKEEHFHKEIEHFILSKKNNFKNSSFYDIWNPVIDKTDYSWVQLDTNSIFDIHEALFNEILQQVWLDFIRLNKV